MLTCALCGSRPASEFELLPAEGASIEGAMSEYWWHRLGCGRPTVVLRCFGEGHAAVGAQTRAAPAAVSLATPAAATLAATTLSASALTTSAAPSPASPAVAAAPQVAPAAVVAAPALAARDESATAGPLSADRPGADPPGAGLPRARSADPPNQSSPADAAKGESGKHARLPLAEPSPAARTRPGLDDLPAPAETLAPREQPDRRPAEVAPAFGSIGSLWSPTRSSRRVATSPSDPVPPSGAAGASAAEAASDGDPAQRPSRTGAETAGTTASKQAPASESARRPESPPADAELVVLSAEHDQPLVDYHYASTGPIGGSVDLRGVDPPHTGALEEQSDVSASEVDDEALDRFRGRARLGGVEPLPRRTGVPTPWRSGAAGPPQQVQVGRRASTATAVSQREGDDPDDPDGPADSADPAVPADAAAKEPVQGEMSSADASPTRDPATTGRRVSGMFSRPRADSREDHPL